MRRTRFAIAALITAALAGSGTTAAAADGEEGVVLREDVREAYASSPRTAVS